jgi:1-aminocyclopropane-1-carboxylate deaminase/D-cysteine desulfhydrase-like pyridoxal-dependent ACC family enzyme
MSTSGLMLGPTPLQSADRLGAALGLAPGRLFVKRDDLTPLAGGGNKVRKLDHLCGAALSAGADVLITGGGPQSNHVRATAAAARALGLDVVAVLSGDRPAAASGNLVIDALMGASMVWTGLTSLAEVETAIVAEGERLRAAGRRPYVIPIGGADPVGSQGYVAVAAELDAQLADIDLVVTPAGSGGTQAGLAAGFGSHERVLGVSVGAFPDIRERIQRLARQTAALAGLPEPAGEARVDCRFAADGYGTELDAARDALRLAARTEGLVLDPVYTAKALAGLTAGLAEGTVSREARIVFLHCGGAFGLLSSRYSDWAAG